MSVAVEIWLRCDPQCTAISCCFLPGLSWRIHDDLCTLYCSPGMCSMFISVADDTWEQDYWISLHPSQHPSHTVTCPGHMTRAALYTVVGRVLQFCHFCFSKSVKSFGENAVFMFKHPLLLLSHYNLKCERAFNIKYGLLHIVNGKCPFSKNSSCWSLLYY